MIARRAPTDLHSLQTKVIMASSVILAFGLNIELLKPLSFIFRLDSSMLGRFMQILVSDSGQKEGQRFKLRGLKQKEYVFCRWQTTRMKGLQFLSLP